MSEKKVWQAARLWSLAVREASVLRSLRGSRTLALP